MKRKTIYLPGSRPFAGEEAAAASIASGGQAPTPADSPASEGKATPAPLEGQGDVLTLDEPTVDTPTPPEGQAADEVSEDSVLESLGGLLDSSPEQTVETLQRDHAASSKEARRLNDLVDSLTDALKVSGAEVIITDGKFSGLKALADADKGPFPAPPKVDDELKTMLLNDEESAIQHVWERAQAAAESHYARPGPTIQSVSRAPSPEALQAAENAVLDRKNAVGDPVFPNAVKLKGVVDSTLEQLSPELREAFNGDPKGTYQMLYGAAEYARIQALEIAKKIQANKDQKAAEAEDNAGMAPGGNMTTHIGSNAPASKGAAQQIAKSGA